MLRRILIVNSPALAKTPARFAELERSLTETATRTWPGARVETLSPEKQATPALDAKTLLVVHETDVALLDSWGTEAGEALSIVVGKTPAATHGIGIAGVLSWEDLSPDRVASVVNNALALRIKATFQKRRQQRDVPAVSASSAASVFLSTTTSTSITLPYNADWDATQIIQRARDGSVALRPRMEAPPTTRTGDDDHRFGVAVLGYRILDYLGRGGVADVFLGERKSDKTLVVIKVIDRKKCADPNVLKRFVQEYTLVSQIHHAHVVRVLDRGFMPEHAFIVMEYLSGGDLARRIEAGVTAQQALAYLRQMAEGLAAIHRQKILHRDMKPANVLFRADGTAVITDFGVARFATAAVMLTSENALVGTPYYLPPEVLKGRPNTYAGDLYSLGVIFYEMLTGEKPYIGDNVDALLKAIVKAPLPRLPSSLSVYQAVVARLMAKNPEERYVDADALLKELCVVGSAGRTTFDKLKGEPNGGY